MALGADRICVNEPADVTRLYSHTAGGREMGVWRVSGERRTVRSGCKLH